VSDFVTWSFFDHTFYFETIISVVCCKIHPLSMKDARRDKLIHSQPRISKLTVRLNIIHSRWRTSFNQKQFTCWTMNMYNCTLLYMYNNEHVHYCTCMHCLYVCIYVCINVCNARMYNCTLCTIVHYVECMYDSAYAAHTMSAINLANDIILSSI